MALLTMKMTMTTMRAQTKKIKKMPRARKSTKTLLRIRSKIPMMENAT